MKTSSITRTALAVVVVLGLCGYAFAGQTIYVDDDADGANNGSSWTDAYNYLQDALAIAASGDEIRVAEGIYKPDLGSGITPGDRDAAFQLINGVILKGGYAGFDAPDPDARDIELYETVLSGDLKGDDVGGMSDPSWDENSRHVLIGSDTDANTVLDGFTIKHGNADSGSQQHGGGMYNSKGDPTLINCKFIENFAGQSGGGLHNYICSPTLINCEFISNYATEQGGGVHSGSLTLTNCRFTGNSAEYGGGISATGTTLNNCEFTENSADYGGAFSVLDRSTLTLNRCKFNGNHADYDGGAMWNWDAENGIAITNCIFVANSTHGYGGAIYNFSSNPVLKHCTFTENSSGSSGSGHAIASESSDYGSLTGCILWDGGYEIYDRTAYGTIITYSDVQGGWPGSNINANPCFVREPYDGGDGWGYGDNDDYGDLRLLPDSPCIDAGDPNYVPEPGETDLDGNPRLISGRVDMGAYESYEVPMYELTVTVVSGHGTVEPDSGFYSAGTVVMLTATPEAAYYVVRQWTGTDDDTSCGLTNTVTMDADKTVTVEFGQPRVVVVGSEPNVVTIQQAIDAAGCGDVVVVPTGVYFEDINFNGKNITVTSTNSNDPVVVASTIIQGTGTGSVVTFSGSESQNCVLDGLTITNNYAGNAHGIYCSGSNPTIINCTISRNTGDGVHCCEASSPYVFNCIISENMGAGVICSWWESDPNITNCTITGNGGEGVWCWKSRPKLTNCILTGNAGGSFTVIAAYPEVSYSCIDSDGISLGIGNINEDPLVCGWSDMAEVYVDNSNPGPGDGTQGNPFSDLASALVYNLALSNQSPCLGTGEGGVNMGADTGICDDAGQPARLVHVALGTYSVRALSLAHNVSVQGVDEQDTVIEGTMFGLRTGAIVSYLTVTAGASGGIRVASDQNPEIFHCIIRDNDNGVSCAEGASPTITDCTIKGNSGRGLSCEQNASPNLTNCIISDNEDRGVSCGYFCSPTLTNCTIAGNSGDYGGGLWFGTDNHPILTNCAIVGNYANYGAGVGMDETSNPTLINCTIAGNSAFEGGGLRLDWDCVPVLTNSIIWGNSDSSGTGQSAQIQGAEMGTPVINYSCLQGWTGSLGGIGNFGDDPLFVDAVTGDCHLMAGSPCIDAGDPNYVPGPGETDLDGNPRIRGDAVDMGAYEFQGILTLYVDADAPFGGDGTSWAMAFKYLQDALLNVISPAEIRVAQGIYKPDLGSGITPGDREATFKLISGVTLKGGYAGLGQPDPNARDISLYETTLSGDMNGDDVEVAEPCDLLTEPTREENSYHVVNASGTDATAILDGFTITGGNAHGDLDYSDPRLSGGGIYSYHGSATLSNCILRANSAKDEGGGLWSASDIKLTLTNCTFIENAVGNGGGGIYFSSDYYNLINCKFHNNSAGYGGGGIYSMDCYGLARVTHCKFTGNTAQWGGGMAISEDTIVFTGCLFSGNHASHTGGGLDCFDSTPTLISCTFNQNFAGNIGGGIAPEGTTTISNCIFWGNRDCHGNGETSQISEIVNINYSCVQGWTGDFGGIGNIGNDPLFIDADGPDDVPGTEDDDLRLLPQSSCLDAGDNDAVPPDTFDLDGDSDTVEPIPIDLDGGDRFTDHPGTPDTGNPGAVGGPIVDIGAYEGAGQGFLLSTRMVVIPEQGTETFTVALAQDPLQTVPVTVEWSSGDIDITVATGASLTFDSSNYSVPQIAILKAAADIDNLDGLACIEITAPGFSTAVVRAIEADNDPVSTAVLYVDANAPGVNNGSSWAQAYNELRDAIKIAARYPGVVKEIRVAQGTYKPTEPSGNSDATFQLVNGMAIYGGYAGFGQPDPDARDIQQYETILSGDLRGDDFEVETPSQLYSDLNKRENSHHVVNGSGTDANTVLDGLTITGGSGSIGAGMYNEGGNPTINQCTFRGNTSYNGSVMYNFQSNPLLTGCTFSNNYGIGMVNNDNSSPTVIDCVFSGNYGSGARNYDNSNPQFVRCLFSDNRSAFGGGMNNHDSNPTLTFCTFVGNYASYDGGGFENRSGNPVLMNCVFVCNSTGYDRWGGGGMGNFEGNPTLINCRFEGNFVDADGAGMYIWHDSPVLINCTFSGNLAGNDSGGLYNYVGSPILTNCILWDNRDQTGASMQAQIGGKPAAISYSCIQDWSGGLGNISANPLFLDPGYWDVNGVWIAGDYHLILGSPCIDTGDPNFMAEPNETDLDGNPRVIGNIVDMGAYEFWGPIYVDDDAPDDPGPDDPQVSDPLENGIQDHPFDTIQEGINVAKDGYTVLVREGSYFEPASGGSIDFLGKNITLRSEDPTDWDIVNNTIIRRYVQFSGTEGPSCQFAGFKISNLEGAIYGNHTHATISHCNISGNGPCGATVIQDCHGTISNCLITDNTTFFYCGIYPVVFECNGLIKNCTIANNESGVSVGSATIENCIIYNNEGPQVAVTNGNTVNISYSNVQDGLKGVIGDGHVNWGPGNIDTDPCFVRLGYWITDEMTLIEGDYHLKSEGWRWNTEDKSWTYNYTTSRCIDAGNPGSPLLGELMSVPRDPNNMWGVNLRINMGAFGGTSQASMPPYDWALLADLNNDGTVNFIDFAYQTQDWLTIAPEQPGDLNRDGVLNKMDLRALAEEWLKTTIWIE